MPIDVFHKSCKQLDGGNDRELTNYIVETNSIRALVDFNSQASIAVGLKGIGKSSAYRYLTQVDKNADICIGINADRYVLHLPQRNYGASFFRKQFERDLIFEALREVVNQSDAMRRRLDASLLSEARKTVDSFLEKLKSAGRKIIGFGISIVGIGLTLHKDSPEEPEGLIPEKDISKAFDILTAICKSGVKIRIVIDDPEEVFSLGAGMDINMIGGFCLACLRLSSTIPGLKIIGLLKTHVYHPVNKHEQDLSKYTDPATYLAWSKEELKLLVKDRLSATSTRVDDVFAGSNEDSQLEVLENMIKMVRNGPRDLLRWIDLTLTKSNEQPICTETANLALEDMSQSSFDELARAHSGTHENIELMIKAIFSKKTKTKFTRAALEKHLETLYLKDITFKALQSLEWFQKVSSITIPRLLFETGSISFLWKNQVILPYQKEYTLKNFEKATSIFLTPALIPVIKEQYIRPPAKRSTAR